MTREARNNVRAAQGLPPVPDGTGGAPYQHVGSCSGICPTRGTRCSPCPQLSTEDNRTPIVEGMRVYNYYDGEWGEVKDVRSDGWFTVNGTSLNGARVSTKEV